MKKLKFLLSTMFIVFFILSSCEKKPTACFTVYGYDDQGKRMKTNKGKIGEAFVFDHICSQNEFGGATVIDYGDGTSGDGSDHTYTKPGTYTVKCTVYGVKNKSKSETNDVATQTIVISELEAMESDKSSQQKEKEMEKKLE